MKTVNTIKAQNERSKLHDEFMTKQPAHTKGEWKISFGENRVRDKDGKLIAICKRDGREKISDEDIANAQRIVKAVNMHDELVESLKDLIERLELDGYDNYNVRIRKAKILLKQAEQK